MSGTAVELERLSRDADMAMGVSGRLFVAVTLEPPSALSMRRFCDAMRARRRVVDEQLLGVFVPSAPRPRLDAEGRAAIRDLWQDIGSQMEVCAVWIRRDSFVGALLRSLVTGLIMVQPRTIITGVVTDARSAIDLLAETDHTLAEPIRSNWAQALETFAQQYAPTRAPRDGSEPQRPAG